MKLGGRRKEAINIQKARSTSKNHKAPIKSKKQEENTRMLEIRSEGRKQQSLAT